MKKLFLILLISSLSLSSFLPAVLAKTAEQYEAEIKQLEAKIASLQTQAKTLANQIAYYDGQIALTELKIAQTEDLITSISGKIDVLETKLDQRTQILSDQIERTYKARHYDAFQLFVSSHSFTDFLTRQRYSQYLQLSNRTLIHDTQLAQTTYVGQKDNLVETQKRLHTQRVALASLRQERDHLLAQTHNDETTYQKLLTKAKAELDSLKAFALFKGGGILPAQPQPDGWYFNQRDERWGRNCIGNTCITKNPEYVWEVGCLITSVAMVHKKYGVDTTPLQIAQNSNNFFSTTAYMQVPWPAPPGYHYYFRSGSYSSLKSSIDSELEAGRPVIVHIVIGGGDGHFVVFKSGSEGKYVMNDPWEKWDLNFTDYYSTGSIVGAGGFVPN